MTQGSQKSGTTRSQSQKSGTRGLQDHQSPPESYECLFTQYWAYTRSLIMAAGIHSCDVDDVAQSIIMRFWERDFLSVFNADHTTVHQGQVRRTAFRTFYTAFVRRYLLHYVERQAVRDGREPLLCDAPVADAATVTWISVHGPVSPGPDHEVLDQITTSQWFEQVRTALSEVALEGVWEVLVELWVVTEAVA